MSSLYAEIEINASANQVWEALVRKEDWRYWNTFLFDCDPGLAFAPGREILMAMQRIEGDEETELQPVITTMRPDVCLRWVSKIPGLRSEHTFELQEIAPGRTRYLHRDTFNGILSNVFLPFIRQDEKQGLRRMAYQLKRYVEREVSGYREDPRNSRRNPQRYGHPDDRYDDRYYAPPEDRRYNHPPHDQPYGRRNTPPNYSPRQYPDSDPRPPRRSRPDYW